MRNGLAAVLIVKDEEKILERCLNALRDVDQLVILDTGSSDRTVEIAKRFTSDVHTEKPTEPFHFGDARNRALEHVRQDWALTVDADEVVKEGSIDVIRKAFWRFPTASGFNVRFILYEDEGKDPSEIMKMKVFRRNRWTWKFRIHEVLAPKTEHCTVKDLPEAVIEHLPQADKAARRRQNLELLKIAVGESPEHLRNERQLGMEFFNREEWPEAMAHFKNYLEGESGDRLDRSEVLMHMGRCQSNMGRLDDALKWFDRAVDTAPERREPHFYRAVALIKGRRLEHAILSLETCLAIPVASKPEFFLNEEKVWDGIKPTEAVLFCRQQIAEAKAKLEAKHGH